MIKKAFIILFTGLSMLSYAQQSTGEETTAAEKTKKEKVKKEKPAKPEKIAKPAKETTATTSEFKPEAGSISVDFTANNLFKIGQNSTQFQLSDNAQGFGGGIRLRYFLSPKGAIRVNFVTDMQSHTGFPVISDPLGNDDGGVAGASESDGMNGRQEYTKNHFCVSLGYEYHFEGTDRLDTYAGAELMYDNVTENEKLVNIDATGAYSEGYNATVSGGRLSDYYTNKGSINLASKSDVWNAAGTGIGARLMAGADFYVFPKVYIGAELGVAMMQKWIKDYDLKEVGGTSGNNKVIKVSNRGKGMNMSQDVTGQFRIGFRL